MEMIGKVWQSRIFSFLYIKSKTAFKPAFRTLSKLAEQLKIRVQRGLKKGLYYEINFIFIIFKKLLRHQPGTQKSGATQINILARYEPTFKVQKPLKKQKQKRVDRRIHGELQRELWKNLQKINLRQT
jgi:hypothetical protein